MTLGTEHSLHYVLLNHRGVLVQNVFLNFIEENTPQSKSGCPALRYSVGLPQAEGTGTGKNPSQPVPAT